MPQVDYQHEFPYLFPEEDHHRSFPGLLIQVLNPTTNQVGIEVAAHLDTGTEASLFNGWIAPVLEINLLEGEEVTFTSSAGYAVHARWHNVELIHDTLGTFRLRVAFSLGEIRRNLLGRDFLNLIQIGLREHQEEFYVTPTP